MKTLIMLFVALSTTVAFAGKNYDMNDARRDFKRGNYSKLDASFTGVWFQSAAMSVNVEWGGVCRDGNMLTTTKAHSKCVLYSYKDSDAIGNKLQYSKSMPDSDEKGISQVKCAEYSTPQILTRPVAWSKQTCNKWYDKDEDGDVVIVTSRPDNATKFDCANYITLSGNTTHYQAIYSYDGEHVGSVKKAIPSCDDELTPVPAN